MRLLIPRLAFLAISALMLPATLLATDLMVLPPESVPDGAPDATPREALPASEYVPEWGKFRRNAFNSTMRWGVNFKYEQASSGAEDSEVQLSSFTPSLRGRGRLGYAFKDWGFFVEGGLGLDIGVANFRSENPNGHAIEHFGEFGALEGEIGLGLHLDAFTFSGGFFAREAESQFGEDFHAFRDADGNGTIDQVPIDAGYSIYGPYLELAYLDKHEWRSGSFQGAALSLRILPNIEYEFADGATRTWGVNFRAQIGMFTPSALVFLEGGGLFNKGDGVSDTFWLRLGFEAAFGN